MGKVKTLDEADIAEYVSFPDSLSRGCSKNTAIFIADGGNHFTQYGIFEGMYLFIDLDKTFMNGRVSCFMRRQENEGLPKYRLSDKPIRGYSLLGRLVMTLRNFEG